jgi:hypothetical protein
MATCKICGQWVAGTATECGRCRRQGVKDPRLRNKRIYNIIKSMRIKI